MSPPICVDGSFAGKVISEGIKREWRTIRSNDPFVFSSESITMKGIQFCLRSPT